MRNYVECNGQRFDVKYKHENNLVWAIAYVNGAKLEKHGDTEETAYWAMEQHIYQVLKFRTGKEEQ